MMGRLTSLVAVNNGAPILLKKHCRRGKSLARGAADRKESKPRCHRRADHMGIWRSKAKSFKGRRG
jgi:hypothetical protein